MQWLRRKSSHEIHTSLDYVGTSKPASATQCDSVSKTKAKEMNPLIDYSPEDLPLHPRWI